MGMGRLQSLPIPDRLTTLFYAHEPRRRWRVGTIQPQYLCARGPRRWWWVRTINGAENRPLKSRKIRGSMRTEIPRRGDCNDHCEANFRFRIHLYPPCCEIGLIQVLNCELRLGKMRGGAWFSDGVLRTRSRIRLFDAH